MRVFFCVVSAAMAVGCSVSIQRPLATTDAATSLEQITRSDVNEFHPAISPDARAVAYEVASTPDALPHVEVMDLTSGRVTYSSKEATGFEPTWMPDGSGVVFVSKTRRSSKGLLQTVGAPLSESSYLVDAGDLYLPAEWPAVAPDGAKMAMALVNIDVFQSGWRTARHLDHALALSDLIGTGVNVLGPGTDPAFSPDGTRIAFARGDGGHAHLFVANADGSNARQITEGPADDIEPSWSPDGSYLVFCSAHGEDHFTQANLFAVRADGSGLVQLTEGDRIGGRPAWAQNGFIYFHANATDRFHIWRLRPAGAGMQT